MWTISARVRVSFEKKTVADRVEILIGNTFGTGIGGGGVWEFGRIVVVSVHEG
jgi:hypothetical protein